MFRRQFLVNHYMPASVSDAGIIEPGIESTHIIFASVHPATGNDIQALPEGRRGISTFKVFTSSQLYPSGHEKGEDRVMLEGKEHTIVKDMSSRNGVMSHYCYLIQAVPE